MRSRYVPASWTSLRAHLYIAGSFWPHYWETNVQSWWGELRRHICKVSWGHRKIRFLTNQGWENKILLWRKRTRVVAKIVSTTADGFCSLCPGDCWYQFWKSSNTHKEGKKKQPQARAGREPEQNFGFHFPHQPQLCWRLWLGILRRESLGRVGKNKQTEIRSFFHIFRQYGCFRVEGTILVRKRS